jgi:uncharacterized protein (DUF885 family)
MSFPRLIRPWLAALSLLAFLPAAPAPAATPREFDAFVDQFIEGWYAFRPVDATRDGIHRHDALFAGYDRPGIDAEVARLTAAAKTLEAMKPAGLDSARVVDRDILLSRIQGEILSLSRIRRWEKDPNFYVDMVTEGVYLLTARPFAPAEERLKSVIARQKAAAEVLGAALENVVNPPRVWTQVAIDQSKGAIEFFRIAVPAAFADVSDPTLRAEFESSTATVVRDLESWVGYLEQALLPAANGDWRLGEVHFQALLEYEEMCDIPVFRLARIGEDHLKTLQLEAKTVAAAIDPEKTPAELFRILSIDHPKPADLVPTTASLLENLRAFCVEKNIATIPDGPACNVRATPEFMRSTLFAALDSPGPFETRGLEANYFVTPPDASLSPIAQDDHMRIFNRYSLPIISMHEAWPGHFLQLRRNADSSSKVRKVFGSASFSEGWGLYVEQMMLDEGWGDRDPKYRLFQVRLALLRACRYLAAIRMHTGQMTQEEAVQFFMTEGFQERIDAEREARRGTMDPMYLSYQLGKLQILKFRSDYQRFRGPDYTLKEFHDRLLGEGSPPVKVLRRILMPGDKGTLL